MRSQTSQNRIIMLIDLDYFYAQCEEIRNPSIKDKPVVVGVYSGRTEDSGAVGTANYIAREYGVKSGIPIYSAKAKLKDVEAVFLPVDHAFYGEVSRRIMKIISSYADHFEQVGIDEAYMDVSRKAKGDFERARRLAKKIKKAVKEQEKLTCSIGVGPNKLIAKIASDVRKPDGLTVVKPERVEKFLSPLPVGRIIGIGSKTVRKMEELGIKNIGELSKYDTQKLVKLFGRNLGTYFHNASLGIGSDRVQERGEVKSLSRISTLKENTRDLKEILDKAGQLSKEIHSELIELSLFFKTVGVIAIMEDLGTLSRSKSFESPTNELDTIDKAVEELFEKLIKESELEIRRVGVKVSNFHKEQKMQKYITDYFRKA
ncbi:MAG: DNA polymerase IV [Candidatus Hodarchaeota archaeon]